MWWEREEGSWHRPEALEKAFPGWVFDNKSGKLAYKCLVEWHKFGQEVCNEELQGVRYGPVRKVYTDMQRLWGEEPQEWAVGGCGQGFRPYSEGPSMTLSVLTQKDEGEEKWEALMAERLPQVLDDAIKGSRHISLDQLCNNMDLSLIHI